MAPLEVLLVGLAGVLVVVAAQAVAPRVRIAAPLLLVAIGAGVGELPAVPAIAVDPEWVLAGVLPPLLYASAVAMPAMDFRRELGAISGLSVLLVLLTTLVTGAFLAWAVPGLSLAWGIALGAIVSPTDAVATRIVKPLGVSDRVVTMLEGESLLNDATALVLLRSAIAAAAGAATVPGVLGDFVFAVFAAVLLGVLVGHLNLWLRARTPDATVNTALSFVVPFAASIPAEAAGASGLVAAVVAGLVTGRRAPRVLPPRHRLSDEENWRTVELVLEGGVFLLLGLQLAGLLEDVGDDGAGRAVLVAVGALLLVLAVRTVYVAPLLRRQDRRAKRGAAMRPRLSAAQERLDAPDGSVEEAVRRLVGDERARTRGGPPRVRERQLERFARRIRRVAADVDYLLARPLGRPEGAVVVWAGMRGAVTLAAAQTLPDDAPSRSLLILVAFVVAVLSLGVQGVTLPWLVRRAGAGARGEPDPEERAAVLDLLRDAAGAVPAPATDAAPDPHGAAKGHHLAMLRAQRAALLDARDDGRFDSATLAGALAAVDADEIALELKGAPVG